MIIYIADRGDSDADEDILLDPVLLSFAMHCLLKHALLFYKHSVYLDQPHYA